LGRLQDASCDGLVASLKAGAEAKVSGMYVDMLELRLALSACGTDVTLQEAVVREFDRIVDGLNPSDEQATSDFVEDRLSF
jgi:hypothetical protein